jgi:hypothetical protein
MFGSEKLISRHISTWPQGLGVESDHASDYTPQSAASTERTTKGDNRGSTEKVSEGPFVQDWQTSASMARTLGGARPKTGRLAWKNSSQ